MNEYQAFYKGKSINVQAESSYKAQLEAQKQLRVKDSQRYHITVMLVAKDGEQVTHLPLF